MDQESNQNSHKVQEDSNILLPEATGDSQRMLLTLLSNLPGMAYRCKNQKHWPMEFVSQGCFQLTGYQPDDLQEGGKIRYGDLIHADDQQRVFEQVQVALHQQKPFELTYRMYGADGTQKWVYEKGCGVFGPDGRLLACEGFISDITKQKRAEEVVLQNLKALELAQAETEAERQHFHSLLMQAPSFIGIVSGEEHVLEFSNPLLSELLGPHLKVGQSIVHSFASFSVVPIVEILKSVYQTGETRLVKEMPVAVPFTPDGKAGEAYHNILFKALLDARNQTSRILVFGSDVTEQVKARQKVEQSEARLQRILDGLPQIVWTFLPGSTDINFFNQRWYEYTGLTEKQCREKGWMQAIHPQDRNWIEVFMTEGQKNEQVRQVEHLCRRFDGAYHWHLIRIIPIRDEMGKVVLWIGTATNIHDHKTAQDKLEYTFTELENTFRELEQKNFELDQFVYKTSHDLRSPLSSILGLVDILKQEDNEQTKTHYVDLIENRVHKLDRFIRSMLDYSRNTRTAAQPEKINISSIIEECWQELEYMKHFSRLSLAVEVTEGDFYSDRFRLKIIFSNLISNAIQYQDFNKPESKLVIRGEITNGGVILAFSDNGIGIDEAYQEKIFDMFVRASEQSEGSGLGLYIVRQAVGVLKGSIHVESSKGAGTRFLVSLPAMLSHSIS